MSEPTKIEYEAGRDAYGRPTKLIYERRYDGKRMWAIRSDPINQRDDEGRIDALTTEQLVEIGRIAGNARIAP